MAKAIVVAKAGQPLAQSRSARRLADAFLAGRTPETLRAYAADVEDFRAFVGAGDANEAAAMLLGRGHGAANELALSYRAKLLEQKLSAATVNRRLAALRSLVKLGRTLGMIPWELEVPGLKAESYRDLRGPGRSGFERLMELLTASSPKTLRNRAMVRLLHDLGLRRGEVVSLDLQDLDLSAATVEVLGKGRTARVRLTLPSLTVEALRAWVAVRGNAPGPLFFNFDRAGKGKRITGTSLYRIVTELGRAVGLTVRPHGLRHLAITQALDLTGGDVRAVQKFSRHRDLRVLNVYDDSRRDLAGDVAKRVAEGR